jgi:hypothetical protein
MKVMVFAPDLENIRAWFDIPKRYYQRNKEMVEECDLLHAFERRGRVYRRNKI